MRFDPFEGGLERGVEVLTVEALHQPVAEREFLEAVAHLDERYVDPDRVEFVVELLEASRPP